jgi:hypothetical protein
MTEVYLEIGKKRVFACSLDWPGWCRTAKTEQDALAALRAYSPRYTVIAKRARVAFRPGELSVVEKVTGGATTDFGAQGRLMQRGRRDDASRNPRHRRCNPGGRPAGPGHCSPHGDDDSARGGDSQGP